MHYYLIYRYQYFLEYSIMLEFFNIWTSTKVSYKNISDKLVACSMYGAVVYDLFNDGHLGIATQRNQRLSSISSYCIAEICKIQARSDISNEFC